MSPEIYQIKIALPLKPAIWRRVLIPADLTLARLHDVIQLSMGWEDCHLHEFRARRKRFAPRDPFGESLGGPPTVNETKVRLCEVLRKAGDKLVYTYDFGDTWEHQIILEKALEREPDVAYPQCIAGKLRCPPEDCGGVWGYVSLLEALGDPSHPEHEEMMEWAGAIDPEQFSMDEANARLAHLRPRLAKRAKST
jgi:hypothetical protein